MSQCEWIPTRDREPLEQVRFLIRANRVITSKPPPLIFDSVMAAVLIPYIIAFAAEGNWWCLLVAIFAMLQAAFVALEYSRHNEAKAELEHWEGIERGYLAGTIEFSPKEER